MSAKERGSIHAVAIILLVVALLGALGVVFYQNFMTRKVSETSRSTTVTPQPALRTVRAAFNSKIYAFDYPENWVVATEAASDGSSTITLQNPDKTIRTRIALKASSPVFTASTCGADSPYKLRYYTVDSTPVTKLSDTSASVVVAMTDAVDGGYLYHIGLTEDGGATHATVGDPFCTVDQVGTAARLVLDGTTVTQPYITEDIDFPKLAVGTDVRVKEMQLVKDILATDDYKAAVKILESSRKE